MGVYGVLLFTKAHHSLKLIAYLKLNKNISREEICLLHLPDSLTAATHAYSTCYHTFQAWIGLISQVSHQQVHNKWGVPIIFAPIDNQKEAIGGSTLFFVCGSFRSYQHLRSYQNGYWLGNTYGDLNMLPRWETRPVEQWPDIPLSHITLILN